MRATVSGPLAVSLAATLAGCASTMPPKAPQSAAPYEVTVADPDFNLDAESYTGQLLRNLQKALPRAEVSTVDYSPVHLQMTVWSARPHTIYDQLSAASKAIHTSLSKRCKALGGQLSGKWVDTLNQRDDEAYDKRRLEMEIPRQIACKNPAGEFIEGFGLGSFNHPTNNYSILSFKMSWDDVVSRRKEEARRARLDGEKAASEDKRKRAAEESKRRLEMVKGELKSKPVGSEDYCVSGQVPSSEFNMGDAALTCQTFSGVVPIGEARLQGWIVTRVETTRVSNFEHQHKVNIKKIK